MLILLCVLLKNSSSTFVLPLTLSAQNLLLQFVQIRLSITHLILFVGKKHLNADYCIRGLGCRLYLDKLHLLI